MRRVIYSNSRNASRCIIYMNVSLVRSDTAQNYPTNINKIRKVWKDNLKLYEHLKSIVKAADDSPG